MNTTVQSQQNIVSFFVLIQFFFLIVLILICFCCKNTKEFRVIKSCFNKLTLTQKIIIFFLFNTFIMFITLTLNKNTKINTESLQYYFSRLLLYDFNKLNNKFTFFKKKFVIVKVKAEEADILNNKYYFDDSEENRKRIIKTTFNRVKKDPRDYRTKRIKQHYQDDYDNRPDQFQIDAVHIKSDVNAYVFINYSYDELVLLDKLLVNEIETFQNEQFKDQVLEELNDINKFLQSLGQINDIEKNPYDYILQYKKLPLNPTKMELCYNYLDKKRILNILRFELEKEFRIGYFNLVGKLTPFIVY